MKNNRSYFTVVMWWFLVLLILGGLTIFFTPAGQRVSAREKRDLQSRPPLTAEVFFSGDFSREFEAFLSDNIPGRDTLIDISAGLLDKFSRNTQEDLYYLDTEKQQVEGTDADAGVTEEENPSKVPAEGETAETQKPADAASAAEGERSGEEAVFRLLGRDGNDRVITTYSADDMAAAAQTLEVYADLLPEDGRLSWVEVPWPDTGSLLSKNLDKYSGWENTMPEMMQSITSDKVHCYDVDEILLPHVLEGEEMWLHTDHQWTVHAAYYVFAEMIRDQGMTPPPFYEYSYQSVTTSGAKDQRDTFELMYPVSPLRHYNVRKIDKEKELPFMVYGVARNVSYLCGNQFPWRRLDTGFDTGRNALVIGDCFDYCFTPFLIPYYDHIHATELRTQWFYPDMLGTTVYDMIQRNDIDDIYIIYSETSGVSSQTMRKQLVENLYA